MAMTIELDVQRATTVQPLPENRQFEIWVATALRDHAPAVLTVRLVEIEEMHQLNRRFRGKDAATNVLSFPADLPDTIELPLLGDVVLCAPVVAEEARLQGKSPEAHWAHLTIHGVLHLLGHDHQEPGEAALMEGLEIKLLESLGFPNPYD
jgi:probable rRNA maturation factor